MTETEQIVAKVEADIGAIGDNIDQYRLAAELNAQTVREQQREIVRLQRIENAALRVASSRDANGIVTDAKVLDRLDAALEARS